MDIYWVEELKQLFAKYRPKNKRNKSKMLQKINESTSRLVPKFEFLQQQINNNDRQISAFHETIEVIFKILDNTLKPGDCFYYQLAEGVFTRAQISDFSSLILYVGAKVMVEHNIDDCEVILRQSISKLEIQNLELETECANLNAELLQIRALHYRVNEYYDQI